MNQTVVAIIGSFIGSVVGGLIFLGALAIIRFIKPSEDEEQ